MEPLEQHDTEQNDSKQPGTVVELLRLEQLIQSAETVQEASFIIVNETAALSDHTQAALLQGVAERPLRVTRLSNLSEVDRTAPFAYWCEQLARSLSRSAKVDELHIIAPTGLESALRRDWATLAPPHLLWIPLKASWHGRQGVLLLGRNTPWQPHEMALLQHLSGSYGHALLSHRSTLSFSLRRGLLRPALWGGLLLLLASTVIPVRLSVLSPAEVVPRSPYLVTAPLDGVVETILVQPNQRVSSGELLVQLQDTELESSWRVARQALSVAEAELHQVQQSGFSDPSNKRRVAQLSAQADLKRMELEYAKLRYDHTRIVAPHSGMVIVDRPQEWMGRPVQVGERILKIADPAKVELEVLVAVEDAISLEAGSEVRLFLDTDPLNALPASIIHAAHEPVAGVDRTPSYRVIAELSADTAAPPRIGLRGTAKIYGDEVTLFYYLFRRPITTLRQWLGW